MANVRARISAGILLMLALSTILLVWSASQASAQSVTECQEQIDALRIQTQNATFIGQNADKDQAGLLGKLQSASVKLSQGKFADAIQALTNFRDKASTLGAQDKLNETDAANLVTGANNAITCVQGLQSSP